MYLKKNYPRSCSFTRTKHDSRLKTCEKFPKPRYFPFETILFQMEVSPKLKVKWKACDVTLLDNNTINEPFAASGHMVHTGGQAAHWDIHYNGPIRIRSKFLKPAPSAGKRVRARQDWFSFCFSLVVHRTQHSKAKPKQTWNYFRHSIENRSNKQNITWLLEDTKFLFSCWKIFHSFAALNPEYFSNTRREIPYLRAAM